MVDDFANDRNRQKDTQRYEDNDYEIDAAVLSVRRRILSCYFGNIYRGMQQFLSFNPIYSENATFYNPIRYLTIFFVLK